MRGAPPWVPEESNLIASRPRGYSPLALHAPDTLACVPGQGLEPRLPESESGVLPIRLSGCVMPFMVAVCVEAVRAPILVSTWLAA